MLQYVQRILIMMTCLVATGCFTPPIEQPTMEDQVLAEIHAFYDHAADAYLMIGLEYFKLASQMEEKGDAKAYQEYARQAKVYAQFAEQWKAFAAQGAAGETGRFVSESTPQGPPNP